MMKQFTRAFLMQRAPALARLTFIGVFATLVMLYWGGSVALAASEEVGDFTLSAESDLSTSDYDYTGTVLTILSNKAIIISMKAGVSTTTTNTIVLGDSQASGVATNVTLNGVNISVSSGTAIKVTSGTTANITLAGENIVKSGSDCAGISTTNATLTIDGSGTLTATSGSVGAGIGGGSGGAGGIITINGGTVIANGGNGGAGIGGGNNGAGGTITISGGTVTANGGYWGAGIGGGNNGAGGTITISGGTVTANGGDYGGAGIGGGSGVSGGTIAISDGVVTAYGGGDGAGIGGSSGSFTTTTSGTAFIVASSVNSETAVANVTGFTSGVLILPTIDNGFTTSAMVGDSDSNSYTLSQNAIIPNGYTLYLGSGKTFTLASGSTLELKDTAKINLENGGNFVEAINSITYSSTTLVGPVVYGLAASVDPTPTATATPTTTESGTDTASTDTTTTTETTTATAVVTNWYIVMLSTSGGGTLAPELSSFASINMQEGTSYTFGITPNSGSVISAVYVDGTNIGAVSSYTIESIHSNRSIHVDFVSSSTDTTTETEEVEEADEVVEETEEVEEAEAAEAAEEANDPDAAEEPAATPEPAGEDPAEEADATDPSAEEPTEEATDADSEKASGSAVPVAVGAVIFIAVLGGGGYWLYKRKIGMGGN